MTLTVRQSRWKLALLTGFVATIAALVLFVPATTSTVPWGVILLLILLGSGGSGVLGVIHPATVRFDADGFEGEDLFGTFPRVRWVDIDRVFAYSSGDVVWTLKPNAARPLSWRRRWHRLFGVDGSLPSGLSMPSKKLAALMDEYRTAALCRRTL